MDCRSITRSLKAWIDGELDASRASAVQEHLVGCAACRAVADDYRKISSCIRLIGDSVPPPPSVARIRERAREAERAEIHVVRWLQRVSAVAAAVLVMAAAAAFWLPDGAADTDPLDVVLESAVSDPGGWRDEP